MNALISTTEAASILGVNPLTIRNWIKRGVIPGYRVGPTHYRVDRRDVEGLIRPVMPGCYCDDTKPCEVNHE